MRRNLIAPLVLLGCYALACGATPVDIEKSFQLPVLLVSPDNLGSCEHVDFSLTRKAGSQGPLLVAIAEDTPGGAGESTRASVWMAAMASALDRLDDLSGVKITVQLTGAMDGPSAGGVICLAILTALDGRDFPADCAMTGTIMPDGTIGAVGGIAAKMRVAAKSGAKRVLVPAYLRFETDLKSGEEVDLKRLASSLKLEFLPVNNIAQAFRAAHRLPQTAEQPAGRNLLDLPDATEELLKRTYRDDLTSGIKLWDAIPEDEKKQIMEEPVSKAILVGPREKAENAYRSGRLLYASTNIEIWRMFLEARQHNQTFFASLNEPDLKKKLGRLDAKFGELLKAIPEASSLVASSRASVHDSGIQLCADFYDIRSIVGIIGRLQHNLDAVTTDLVKPENNDNNHQNELMGRAINLRAIQLLLADCALAGSQRSVADTIRLAASLPPSQNMHGDVYAVERLFFSAFKAAHNSFETDVVRGAAAELHVSEENALAAMLNLDMALTMYLPVAYEVQTLHGEVINRSAKSDSRFDAAVAAHAFANCLGTVSSLITRWSELDVSADDQGELRYGRIEMLNYLLSAARDNAAGSIMRCKRSSIPCIQPIGDFESAELMRDDGDEDKVSVLASYWRASLQAKVLLMLFTKPQ